MNITQAFNTIVTLVRSVNANAAQHEEFANCLLTLQNHLNSIAQLQAQLQAQAAPLALVPAAEAS